MLILSVARGKNLLCCLGEGEILRRLWLLRRRPELAEGMTGLFSLFSASQVISFS